MKLRHTVTGDLIVSHNPKLWLIVSLCLLLLNFITGGYRMATSPIHDWGAEIYIQLPLLLLVGVPLVYAFTRKSSFHFDSRTKEINYALQSFWSEEKGAIPITKNIEIVIQEGGSADASIHSKRLALVCEDKQLPMCLTYTNSIDFENVKKEIDEWLQKNSIA